MEHTPSEAAQFLERFKERWGSPGSFAALYHPEAVIRSPVFGRPVRGCDICDAVARTRSLLPDIRLDVRDWVARGDVLFLEWTIAATFGGEPIGWTGMSRFTLRDGRAIEELVCFDTLPLWARIDPGMWRPGLLEASQPGGSRESDHVATLTRYYEGVWNRGEVDLLDEVVSRELLGHDAAIGDFGFEQLGETVRMFRSSFPDFQVRAEDVLARDDRIALRFRSAGTFTQEFMGRPPRGTRLSITGLVMYRFSGGKIAEIWVEWDHHRFWREIGAPA